MYQDPASKRWYPATLTKLCQEPRSYIVTTKQGVQYRKTQSHLKSYKLQDDTSENKLLTQNTHNGTVTSAKYKHNNANLAQSRARKTLSLLKDWIYNKYNDYLVIRLCKTLLNTA